MKKLLSEHWKRYAWSSGVTFLAAFGLVVLPQLKDMSWESLGGGALVGLLLVGVRAGLKAVVELLVVWLRKRAV